MVRIRIGTASPWKSTPGSKLWIMPSITSSESSGKANSAAA